MQPLIEYEQSTGLVRDVYDDIRATRKTDDINNFWKAIANHPPTLQRTPKAQTYYPHIGMTKHDSCWIIPRQELGR